MKAQGCGVSRDIAVEKYPLCTANSTDLLIESSKRTDDETGFGVKE
jgi:hypothetical protein